jgi:hypothetical protein
MDVFCSHPKVDFVEVDWFSNSNIYSHCGVATPAAG